MKYLKSLVDTSTKHAIFEVLHSIEVKAIFEVVSNNSLM